MQQAPIPLQVTMPGAGDLRRAPVTAVAATAAVAAPTTPVTVAGDKQPTDWVAAAMMHGLDRYRDMKRREDQPARASQVDTEL